MSDTVGKQAIRTIANTDAVFQLVDSAGTNLAGVDASNNVKVNINAQSLAAVKISRDGATVAATNGSYVEVTTANAILAANNPLSVQVSNGTNYNGVTHPLFVELSDGTNANAANHPQFVELSDGSAALGVSGNPIYTTPAPASGGTTITKTDDATVTAGASTNIDYTVTAGKTLTINQIMLSCPEAGHYALIKDPAGANTTIMTVYLSPGSTSFIYTFARSTTVAATLVFRVQKFNDSNQTAQMSVYWEGSEV